MGVPDRNFNTKTKSKTGSDSEPCTFGPLQTHGWSVVLVSEFRLGDENEVLHVAIGFGI